MYGTTTGTPGKNSEVTQIKLRTKSFKVLIFTCRWDSMDLSIRSTIYERQCSFKSGGKLEYLIEALKS